MIHVKALSFYRNVNYGLFNPLVAAKLFKPRGVHVTSFSSSKLVVLGNISKSLFNKKSFQNTSALISRKSLNIWKASTNHISHIHDLNYKVSPSFLVHPCGGISVNAIVTKSQILSGLIDLLPDFWKKPKTYQEEFNSTVVLIYIKVFHTIGFYKIHNELTLFQHFDKFFLNIDPLFQKMKFYSEITAKYMAIQQHILVALFRDKALSIENFKNYTEANIDFSLYKRGNILLLIETFVLKKTVGTLFNDISFMAINPESPLLDATAFNKKISFEKTGQMHSDWFGTRAICDKDGNTTISHQYNDVKMFESGAMQGRLAIKPGLILSNNANRAYLTKYQTGLTEHMKSNKINDKNLIDFLKIMKTKTTNSLYQIKQKTNNNKFNSITNTQDVKEIIMQFNAFILKTMKTEISAQINLGISASIDIDSAFLDFYKNILENILKQTDITKYDLNILLSSKVNKLIYRQQLQLLIDKFLPPEMKEAIIKLLEFIDKNP